MKRQQIYVGQRTLLAKTCSRCFTFKQVSDFERNRVNGGWYRSPFCRACRYLLTSKHSKRENSKSLATATHQNEVWSPVEIEKLLYLYDQGFSGKFIAKQLGRSVSSIYKAKHKHTKD